MMKVVILLLIVVAVCQGASPVKRDTRSDVEEEFRRLQQLDTAISDDTNEGNTDDLLKRLNAIRQQQLDADDDVDETPKTSKRFWGKVTNWFKGAASSISGWFENAGESIADFFGGALDTYAHAVENIGSTLGNIGSDISKYAGDQLSTLKDEANKVVQDIQNTYNSASGDARTAAGKLLQLAKNQRNDVVSRYNTVQGQLCQGIRWTKCSVDSQCTSSTCTTIRCRNLWIGSRCF